MTCLKFYGEGLAELGFEPKQSDFLACAFIAMKCWPQALYVQWFTMRKISVATSNGVIVGGRNRKQED